MPLTLLPPFQPAGVKWLLEREKDDGVRGGFLCVTRWVSARRLSWWR